MRIEGKNSIYETLQNNITINKLFVEKNLKDNTSNKIIALAKQKGIRINFCDKVFLDSLSKSKKHQGFVADVVDFEYCDLEDMLEKDEPLLLVLDGIEDPHNFGAIIRSAECFGVDGIIIPKYRACAVNDTVVKVSAGAIQNMKIAMVTNLNQTIEKLKKQNIWVFGLELGGDEISKTNLTGGTALVVGSEGKGISELTKKLCDGIVSITMFGTINSLNASVATGVALYEISKQRNK